MTEKPHVVEAMRFASIKEAETWARRCNREGVPVKAYSGAGEHIIITVRIGTQTWAYVDDETLVHLYDW